MRPPISAIRSKRTPDRSTPSRCPPIVVAIVVKSALAEQVSRYQRYAVRSAAI